MKNILVLVHDDAGQEARLQAAFDLTRAFNGHLTCLDVAVAPPPVAPIDDMGMTAIAIADARQREDANRERLEPRLKAEQISYEWLDRVGFLSAVIEEGAGLADLIVLNRELDACYPDMRRVAGEVLIDSGKPLVAVPEKSRGFDAFGRALIAWDGSPEADAALRAAVPLLQLARDVTILEVDDGSIKMPAQDAAVYLSRHAIRPVVRHETSQFDIPSTVMLDAIDNIQAAYLVMGGFGHSRLIEAALGGVSKRMLQECPVPLFLAH